MAGTTPITIWTTPHTQQALKERLAAEQAKLLQVLAEDRWAITWSMPSAERRRLKAQLRAHLAGLRERGELLDTLTALAAYAVRAELVGRGWNHDWPPVPDTAPKAGRWPGSIDKGWTVQIRTRIPAELAQRVHAACWHTSKDAIEALRAWRDNNPGIITQVNAPDLWEGYVELAKQVTVPGKVWRASLDRVLRSA
ncbi:hypothetical protein GCM10022252_75180 [Streptosporangium oxazolinicum]|uniref:Uncharacterized protein n=1 Tax=Streptosporangium oxazolinicum TaxID=909287 RepID=A0ABP8BKG6_9ACTN